MNEKGLSAYLEAAKCNAQRICSPSCERRLKERKAKQDKIGGSAFLFQLGGVEELGGVLGAHVCHLAELRPKISLLRGFGKPTCGALPAG